MDGFVHDTAGRLAAVLTFGVAHGGATVHLLHGHSAQGGFAVNRAGTCHRIPLRELKEETSTAVISAVLRQNTEWFAEADWLGAWVDSTNGVLVLDRVDVVDDLSQALELGRRRGQRFIHDIAAAADIPVRR